MCDRFGLLNQGRLMHEGTLAELQQSTGLTTLTDMFLAAMPADQPQEPAAA
jgi:ABC-2 type transport system ATP-binding protein/sodium transport system ATP-binding protein